MSDEPMEIVSSELEQVKDVICVLESTVCLNCIGRRDFRYHISIDTIEAKDANWNLSGEGKIHKTEMQCRCPRCAAMFRALMYMIPIECAPFSCPQCGQIQELEYKIQQIRVKGDEFQFEA